MRIESVRSLKQEIREGILAPLANQDLERRRLGVLANRRKGPVSPKTIALGVTAQRDGVDHYQLAVRVQHPLLWDSPEIHSIRAMANGELDIRFIGTVQPLQAPWYQERCMPLRMGCTIGHYQITAGSLGAFVRDRRSGSIQILSNNHVLADENRGTPGDPILQPGHYDHGIDPADAVATLNKFVPIDFQGVNLVDCATANLTRDANFDAKSLDAFGRLSGGRTDPLVNGESIYKIGRTTGLTTGVITAIEVDNITVTYDQGTALFDSQIEAQRSTATPFASGGDSGSLVVDSNNLAIGLLFGGTQPGASNASGCVYINHLDDVLNSLNADLLW